jgi:hypothetical protein
MDAAEDAREESQRLTVCRVIMEYLYPRYLRIQKDHDSHKIAYGPYRWVIRLTAATSMILRFGLVEGGGQITTRALSSSNIAACPPYVLPTPPIASPTEVDS